MIHTNLPIYKKGYDLLSLAADVQLKMPRTEKRRKNITTKTVLEYKTLITGK